MSAPGAIKGGDLVFGSDSGAGAIRHTDIERQRIEGTVTLALRGIADALGDVDIFIAQYTPEARRMPRIAAISERLLAAGRAKEALSTLDALAPERARVGEDAWETAGIAALEVVDRAEEAENGARITGHGTARMIRARATHNPAIGKSSDHGGGSVAEGCTAWRKQWAAARGRAPSCSRTCSPNTCSRTDSAGAARGNVEGMVGFGRRSLMVPVPEAPDLDALNAMLLERCRARQDAVLRGADATIGARRSTGRRATSGC